MAFSIFTFSYNTSASHSGGYEGHCVLRCDILWFGKDLKTSMGKWCCHLQITRVSYAAKATNTVHVSVVLPHRPIITSNSLKVMTKMVENVRRVYHFWRLSPLLLALRFEIRVFKKRIEEVYTRFWWGGLRKRDHLEDLL
jgi:hypothetical protein